MKTISIKGVLVGGIVDIALSLLLGVPFAVYAIHKVELSHIPKEQVGAAVKAATSAGTPIYLAELIVGLGCSVLGGYVAARLARHHELLNGALASFLCIFLGIFTLRQGKTPLQCSCKFYCFR